MFNKSIVATKFNKGIVATKFSHLYLILKFNNVLNGNVNFIKNFKIIVVRLEKDILQTLLDGHHQVGRMNGVLQHHLSNHQINHQPFQRKKF